MGIRLNTEGCGYICSDNRFELIEKYKQKLIKKTNIKTAKDEMKVLDNILFRLWQIGWLDKLEKEEQAELKNKELEKQEAERRILRQKESLRETIKMLKLIFEYAKQLKEEKENHEREIGSPVIEFVWQQEYKLLGDVIDILEMHEFML